MYYILRYILCNTIPVKRFFTYPGNTDPRDFDG